MGSYTVSWFDEDGERVVFGFEASGSKEAREKAAEILERETGLDLRQIERDINRLMEGAPGVTYEEVSGPSREEGGVNFEKLDHEEGEDG